MFFVSRTSEGVHNTPKQTDQRRPPLKPALNSIYCVMGSFCQVQQMLAYFGIFHKRINYTFPILMYCEIS